MILEMIEWWNGMWWMKGLTFRAYSNRNVRMLCTETTPPSVFVHLPACHTSDIQLSFTKRTSSSERFEGCKLTGMDMGVNHSTLEGGSGGSGIPTAGVVNKARDGNGSLHDITVI